MENELSEIEKAACYIQMLKQEGKLDEAAIPELLQMYAITQEEAQTLLESFKKTDDYKKSVTIIFKEQIALVVSLVGIGGFFLFAGFGDRDKVNLFAAYGILYVLAAFGLTMYLLKLLRERFANSEKYAWFMNKALPYVVVLSLLVGYQQYHFFRKSYLLDNTSWRATSITLNSDCKEKRTGGKHPIYYYEFFCNEYEYPIRWYKESHLYAFNKNLQPDIFLHKGDIVTVFVTDLAKRHDYISIGNVIKNKEGFLNIAERNKKAKVDVSIQNMFGIAIFFIAAFVFVFIEVRRRRKIY
jgi:hypothetical protein